MLRQACIEEDTGAGCGVRVEGPGREVSFKSAHGGLSGQAGGKAQEMGAEQ